MHCRTALWSSRKDYGKRTWKNRTVWSIWNHLAFSECINKQGVLLSSLELILRWLFQQGHSIFSSTLLTKSQMWLTALLQGIKGHSPWNALLNWFQILALLLSQPPTNFCGFKLYFFSPIAVMKGIQTGGETAWQGMKLNTCMLISVHKWKHTAQKHFLNTCSV